MRPFQRWLYVISGLAAVFVAVAVAVQAIRQSSWTPVIVAGWPGAGRRCLPRRR